MKKSVKLLLLSALLAALIGSYALVNRMNERAEVAEESGSIALTERDADALVGLRWTSGGEELHLVRKDGAWADADDADFPANQQAIDDLADRFLTMEANRRLADVEDATEYGIGEDSFAVTAEWSDGSETVYAMGDETPFADGWYLQRSDDAGAVYASPSALDAVFADARTDLAQWEEIPRVESANRLTVGGALEAARSEDPERFDPEQDWYDAETGEPLDDEAVEEVLSTLAEIEWQQLLDVSATEEELREWQLDDAGAAAFTARGEDGQACALLLGGADADGNRYARLPDSGMVYTVAADSADRLLAATGDGLRSAKLFTIDEENLKEFTAMLDGREQRFEIPEGTEAQADEEAEAVNSSEAPAGEAADSASEEKTDAEGEVAGTDETAAAEASEADETAAEDKADTEGEATEEEAANAPEALWKRIAALTASGAAEDAPQGEALLELCATNARGMTLRCEFHLHDVDSYVAAMSDGRTLLVPAADVDALIRALRQ